jgi:hypothetical protein
LSFEIWIFRNGQPDCDHDRRTLVASSNIPASPGHSVYISQLIRISKVCAHYNGFLDRAQLFTQNIPKQGYAAPKLKHRY